MKTVGLTGNMGSGKSIVSGIFTVLGVPVFHADEESKKLLVNDQIKESIRKEFGPSVFGSNAEVDRRKLAEIVFSDALSLKKLNQILHPLVRENFREWVSRQNDRYYVLHEAAIIFESGFEGEFDKIIHVSCPAELAVARVTGRDNLDRDEIIKRMRFQMQDEKKAALSDFVIRNDGSQLIIPQVLSIHKSLSEVGP